MLLGRISGDIQTTLGRRFLRCNETNGGWAELAAELTAEPIGDPHPFVRDNRRVAALVGRLRDGRPSTANEGDDGILRLLELLTTSVARSEEARAWVPDEDASEKAFKQAVLEPFVESRVSGSDQIHVALPPWETIGEPPRRCHAHTAAAQFYRSACWKRCKWWASVDAFGKRHNFDLAAEPGGRFRADVGEKTPSRRAPGETLVVEVKLIKNGATGVDPRFIGQLLLARSIHDHVVGVCAVARRRRASKTADGDFAGTRDAVERLGAHFVLVETASS